MQILVTEYPKCPRECLFSKLESTRDFYVCTLRSYIPDADTRDTGYKPKCICKDVSKCEHLRKMIY